MSFFYINNHHYNLVQLNFINNQWERTEKQKRKIKSYMSMLASNTKTTKLLKS